MIFILLVVILTIALLLVPSRILNSYISGMTGTKVESALSYSDLIKGNLALKYIIIYSSEDHDELPAVRVDNLDIEISVYSLTKPVIELKSITFQDFTMYSRNINSVNNLNDIAVSMKKYLVEHNQSHFQYKIDEAFYKRILYYSYYSNKLTKSMHLNNIVVKDIPVYNNLIESIISSLVIGIEHNLSFAEDMDIELKEIFD